MVDTVIRYCEGIDCEKVANLQCPNCIKLELFPSYFCGQDCFAKNWPQHKQKHVTHSEPAPTEGKTYDPWAKSFQYTGKLRPRYPLTPTRPVSNGIKRPDYADTGVPASEISDRGSTQIVQLSPNEIKKLRKACRLGREVLNEGRKIIKPGTTTDEIDRVVHDACMERRCYPSPLNYNGFPKSCCTSVNEIICHGIPDQYELQEGDIVNLDVSTFYDGFHGDLNETYPVGQISEKAKKLIAITRSCLDRAIAASRQGVLYRDLGNVIQKTAQAGGFSVVKSYCGHGIHRLFHCAPNVPHYAKNKAIGVMKPGNAFTIEPMINEGTWRDELWPDNWTSATADGKLSAQFEETLLITDNGVEILTRDPEAKQFWADKGVEFLK